MTVRVPLTLRRAVLLLRSAVLLLAGLLLLAPSTAAVAGAGLAASDAYQPAQVVGLEVQARRCTTDDADLLVSARVATDARVSARARRSAVTDGRVRFSVDGRALAIREVGDDGTARFRIRQGDLRTGGNRVRVDYLPTPGSNLQPVTETIRVTVVTTPACGGAAQADETTSTTNTASAGPGAGVLGGLLPNTGGVWRGLLFLATAALVAGGWLLRRSGSAAGS